MNKNYYNELLNIKSKINYIIKNLDLNNISFDKKCIKMFESKILCSNINNLDDNIIYKTLNSFIIKKNNNLYCYNNKCYKQLSTNKDETIYSNNEFYVKITSNNIVFIDNEFKTKYIRVPFTINNVMIKNNLIIIIGENNNILINKFTIYDFVEYEIVDLYNFILFYSTKNSILINNNGYIVNSKINNVNVKIILDSINRFGNIKNLIECYANEK